MYATAVVGGKVVRFKLSPALARAHRQNRGKAMTEAEAVAACMMLRWVWAAWDVSGRSLSDMATLISTCRGSR